MSPPKIMGQAPDGIWHVASSTYTATMHTKCGRWLRAIAFVVQGGGLLPKDAAQCPTCAYAALAQLR